MTLDYACGILGLGFEEISLDMRAFHSTRRLRARSARGEGMCTSNFIAGTILNWLGMSRHVNNSLIRTNSSEIKNLTQILER